MEERRYAWKSMDLYGDRWNNRRIGKIALLLFYLYSYRYPQLVEIIVEFEHELNEEIFPSLSSQC